MSNASFPCVSLVNIQWLDRGFKLLEPIWLPPCTWIEDQAETVFKLRDWVFELSLARFPLDVPSPVTQSFFLWLYSSFLASKTCPMGKTVSKDEFQTNWNKQTKKKQKEKKNIQKWNPQREKKPPQWLIIQSCYNI